MKRVEVEALVKSFSLFFISMAILVSTIFYMDYKKEVQTLNETIFSQMRICSFDLKCDEYGIDFVPSDKHELYKLYLGSKGATAYFSIPNSTKNSIKIHLSKNDYSMKLSQIRDKIILNLLVVMISVFILSLLFSFYALSPLRKSLYITEEFIKDILHDFNTPLSTLRLNTSMLKREYGRNGKIDRMENSVQNILDLQSNLRSYLHNHVVQNEEFDLKSLLENRVSVVEKLFNHVAFNIEVIPAKLYTNRDMLSRIVDNLLTNAAKYNKINGHVEIVLKDNILYIKDSGKGIENPARVFERFYKEQERGIGIGLHIVKKFCDELGINIVVESQLNIGTTFSLDLKKLLK